MLTTPTKTSLFYNINSGMTGNFLTDTNQRLKSCFTYLLELFCFLYLILTSLFKMDRAAVFFEGFKKSSSVAEKGHSFIHHGGLYA